MHDEINETDEQKEIEYVCKKCHDTGWVTEWTDDGIKYVTECECGIRQKMIHENQLQFAEVPTMYKDCKFSNLKTSVYKDDSNKEKFKSAAIIVKQWINNLTQIQNDGIGLYIYSTTKGSGKTRLACSIANELIEKHHVSVKFTTSLKILDEIKATWGTSKGNETENRLISELTYADVLIIDDFGIDSGRDWINEKFYGIINGRYIEKKPTIFTSNYPLDALKYDDRITDRIEERTYKIHFPEESVRKNISNNLQSYIDNLTNNKGSENNNDKETQAVERNDI